MEEKTFVKANNLLAEIRELEEHIEDISVVRVLREKDKKATYDHSAIKINPDIGDGHDYKHLYIELLPFEPKQFMRLYLLNCREKLANLKKEFENL